MVRKGVSGGWQIFVAHFVTKYAKLIGDFSDWVNVFKPGTGTITIWENTGGVRGAQIYTLKGIPLTPGPLVAVIKVAASVSFTRPNSETSA